MVIMIIVAILYYIKSRAGKNETNRYLQIREVFVVCQVMGIEEHAKPNLPHTHTHDCKFIVPIDRTSEQYFSHSRHPFVKDHEQNREKEKYAYTFLYMYYVPNILIILIIMEYDRRFRICQSE